MGLTTRLRNFFISSAGYFIFKIKEWLIGFIETHRCFFVGWHDSPFTERFSVSKTVFIHS